MLNSCLKSYESFQYPNSGVMVWKYVLIMVAYKWGKKILWTKELLKLPTSFRETNAVSLFKSRLCFFSAEHNPLRLPPCQAVCFIYRHAVYLLVSSTDGTAQCSEHIQLALICAQISSFCLHVLFYYVSGSKHIWELCICKGKFKN